MRINIRFAAALLLCAAAMAATASQARAIPLFAQRYRLQCGACHSVLPELNSFGLSFRAHGYRLALPRHGTTGVAIRYQLEYEQNPPTGQRRYTPAGVLLSNADVGAITAFVHYNFGAGGGPAALYLGYLATYNAHARTLYRAGLFELPLAQSPGQRLDDLVQYGYYGRHVGLNDLPLSSPRWGLEVKRQAGETTFDGVIAYGEYQGSAYGGKPVDTGVTTAPRSPEYFLITRAPIVPHFEGGVQFDIGARSITQVGRPTFTDGYRREGLLAHAYAGKFDFQAEQWWGIDFNSDGFGTRTGSSGGYARAKYYPTPHWYLGVRYDASANPVPARDWVYYTAFHVTPHARLLLQQAQTVGGPGSFGIALTVAGPWPPNL